MQLKDVTPIIAAIIGERDKIPLLINTERYIPNWQPNHHGNAMRGGIRKALRLIEQAPVVDAVPVVRCNDCENWDRDWEPSSSEAGAHFCPLLGIDTAPDFYCKKGERRQDHAE